MKCALYLVLCCIGLAARAEPVEPALANKMGAKAEYRKGDPRVATHQFSFCQEYQATPARLFIMGGRDDRLDGGWVDELKTRSRVKIIPGADHFMDGEHEFDLLVAVLDELKTP